MSGTTLSENATLDGWFGAVALTPPGTWYAALSTTSPT